MVEKKQWYPQQPLTFRDVSLDRAKDMLIYGANIYKVPNWGDPHERKFYLLEDNSQVLQWVSPKKKFNQSRIMLKEVTMIRFGL